MGIGDLVIGNRSEGKDLLYVFNGQTTNYLGENRLKFVRLFDNSEGVFSTWLTSKKEEEFVLSDDGIWRPW